MSGPSARRGPTSSGSSRPVWPTSWPRKPCTVSANWPTSERTCSERSSPRASASEHEDAADESTWLAPSTSPKEVPSAKVATRMMVPKSMRVIQLPKKPPSPRSSRKLRWEPPSPLHLQALASLPSTGKPRNLRWTYTPWPHTKRTVSSPRRTEFSTRPRTATNDWARDFSSAVTERLAVFRSAVRARMSSMTRCFAPESASCSDDEMFERIVAAFDRNVSMNTSEARSNLPRAWSSLISDGTTSAIPMTSTTSASAGRATMRSRGRSTCERHQFEIATAGLS